MTRNRDNLLRYIFVGSLFIVVCVIYIFIFIDLQVSGQDYYTMAPTATVRTRTVKLQAQRGEIYDRNGKKLVENSFSYDLRLDYGSMPQKSADKNSVILSLLDCAENSGSLNTLTAIKYSPFTVSVSGNNLSFKFNPEFFELTRANRYKKLAGELNVPEDADASTASAAFLTRYALTDSEGKLIYSPKETKTLFEYRMDMDMSDFSPDVPYTFAENVSIEFITEAKESATGGFTVFCDYERVYLYPGYASHILGRVGKIPGDNLEYYTALGYSFDAVVGNSGVEYSFENYLHGLDGEMLVTEDASGNIIKTEITKEPVAGLDVYLTIDIDLQIEAEDSLHENILFVQEEAAKNDGERDGEDASAGALTAVDPDTGEVLVLASYPTYNLATFSEDVGYLNTDENTPMVNRALSGLYQPGSTFKPGVAVAALDSGVITPYTIIDTKGRYTKYGSDGPRCWLYLMSNDVHGPIDVTEAIQESCNYFFYEIGDTMTIDLMNKYMSSFGLGESTGIELYEKTGVLAGPEYRIENNLDEWYPGDTLRAAIGQSDHLFTPLQITMYTSALVNDGTRYSAHILYKVCRFGSGELVFAPETSVISTAEVSKESCEVVRNAMKNVIENGSASEIFEDYPITIGGKTGTAQVSKTKSDNAIFTAFAPFDDPELVVTCVIEQGNTGSNAGVAVKGHFDYYFGVGDHSETPSAPTDNTPAGTPDGTPDGTVNGGATDGE
ncbi:MAG: hypothetical protein IKM46_01755 [Clostridia bacterium]|nr:hypothetical protein [Clostridia bacterium]